MCLWECFLSQNQREWWKKNLNYKIVCPKLKIKDPRAIIQIQELMRREGKTVPSSILMVCAHSGITQRASTLDMIIFWFYLFRKHCIKATYPPGLCFSIYQISSCGFFWFSTHWCGFRLADNPSWKVLFFFPSKLYTF